MQLLLSQASKDMQEPLFPMLFPKLEVEINGAIFQYSDLNQEKSCRMKTYLVADSGYNKEQLSNIVETICPNFREHKEKGVEKNVPLSHGIAQLINRDFVSLHRDSESAQNYLPSWRKKST